MSDNPETSLLIVEDEPELRGILAEILTGAWPSVLAAEDGGKALELVLSRPIIAILSDIRMPVMGGLELLREVRQRNLDIPFVFLSAYGDRMTLHEALRLGATDFIDKPFDGAQLEETVRKACELGVAARRIAMEVEELVRCPGVPPERIEHLRRCLRLMRMIRIQAEIFGSAPRKAR